MLGTPCTFETASEEIPTAPHCNGAAVPVYFTPATTPCRERRGHMTVLADVYDRAAAVPDSDCDWICSLTGGETLLPMLDGLIDRGGHGADIR